jgi:hypothetical protein
MMSYSQDASRAERSGSLARLSSAKSDNGQRTTDNGRVPDALMLPEGRKQGTRMVDRVASIAGIAEPLLQVDRARGERAYIRLQGNGKLFVSKSIFDTIVFPKDHQRDGQPRYRWELQPDGAEFGFLISE